MNGVEGKGEGKKKEKTQAHACNPSYLGGRDQENLGLKPAWANSS
jgi:hypothetical protein